MDSRKAPFSLPVPKATRSFRTGAAFCALALAAALVGVTPHPASVGEAPLTANLVKDSNAGSASSFPFSLTDVDGTLFFITSVDVAPARFMCRHDLWKSDGTEDGTVLVKHVSPPTDCSEEAGGLTAVGDTLFFTADDGRELWKSDGTEEGTVMVKDKIVLLSMTAVDGTLYFRATDGTHGLELWKSDGTEEGTVLVKDINPGPAWSGPSSLTDVRGTLYFRATDGTHGLELWKSDGTEDGTVLVKDINADGSSLPSSLTEVGGTLFFASEDGIHGTELWKSDGTEEGTAMVKDINADGSSLPSSLTEVGGTLFFAAEDGIHGTELWKSDGTEEGTAMVKDINPDGHSSLLSLTNVDRTLFFVIDRRELWKSDGTEEGTVMVKDIDLGPLRFRGSEGLTAVGSTLFFAADDDIHGENLWKSDGTEDGTEMVKDINPDGSSFASSLTEVGGTLFFVSNDGIHGDQPWKSDGTEDGTVMVKEIINPIENRSRTIGLGPRLLRNHGVAQGRVRMAEPNRPRCFRGVSVRVWRRPLTGGTCCVVRRPFTDARGFYRAPNRILRPDGSPRPGRYRAIAPWFAFTTPDGIGVNCLGAVSPVRRVARR